jgi:hypothetical protein
VDAAGRICLSDHANGLIGLLHLAKGMQPGGIHAALGQNNQTNWMVVRKLWLCLVQVAPMGSFHLQLQIFDAPFEGSRRSSKDSLM